ncbi:MAG: UDP-N-acetylglucosamine 2-epimerase (non-hydrolyzing) [Candidatus Omnitrophica bacterium]|nr:UDP-N-acetylglucosamine 2-epimerase (non-hydrolyzing) [Candidatus Omnitrophota bacterium]
MMLICNVVGARPNFMKMSPVIDAVKKKGFGQFLVHTGQHYDDNMSKVFFKELGLPKPDVHLGVGSDTHARQVGRIMIAFEDACLKKKPDLVVVGGDVNSTLGAALVAAKLHIPLAHVEAGLRSFDRTMPEEINRIVADQLSTLLFTTEKSGNENLEREGVAKERIHFVGNCMVDTLLRYLDKATGLCPWKKYGVEPGGYAVLTLHRPINVDSPKALKLILDIINKVSHDLPVIFSVHPRTKQHLMEQKIETSRSVQICEPLPYYEFIGLMAKARCILTDSGGIQEEATVVKVPCLTLRENTERPVTVSSGTNRVVGTDSKVICEAIDAILAGKWQAGRRPPLWDGKSGLRIADAIEAWAAHR